MSKSDTTERPIEVEVGICDGEYIGTISLPPDGANAWWILHEETGPSLLDVEARLAVARKLPSWPCRYCSDWMLKQTSMFLRDGVCEACNGSKIFSNPDYCRSEGDN